MSKVKKGFSGLDVLEQIERVRLIAGAITGNPVYVTPNPSIPTVTTANDLLEVLYNESRGHDKNKLALMRMQRQEVLYLVGQLAAYVQEASDGDAAKIMSSGFDVVGPYTPRPVIAGGVFNLRLKDGSNTGRVRAEWDKASYALIYVIVVSASADFSNPKLTYTTKTKTEITGLTPAAPCWVKVYALGKEEPGPESAPATIMVR